MFFSLVIHETFRYYRRRATKWKNFNKVVIIIIIIIIIVVVVVYVFPRTTSTEYQFLNKIDILVTIIGQSYTFDISLSYYCVVFAECLHDGDNFSLLWSG